MADEAKNMGGLSKTNEKKRMALIVGGVLVAGVVGLGIYSVKHKTPARPSGTDAAVSMPTAPAVKSTPGTNDSPQHVQLINEANQQGASDASANNTSFVPTIVANGNAGADPFDIAKQKGAGGSVAASAPVATAPVVVASQPVAAQPVVAQPVVAQQPVDPELRARVNQREQLMASAMQKMLDGWVPGTQAMETDYTGQARQATGAQAGTATAANGSTTANAAAVSANASQNAADATPLIKAASIIPAVLMTSINSDEPGPVLAQLVTGPFEGARALGTFTKPAQAEKAVLQFTMLSIPGAQGRTLTINAFAVDPESARTALASDVDHHYLSRYGLLAASAFLSGYGNALQTSGGTQTQGLYGTQTTYPQINTAQKAFVALGQVGQVAGTQLQSEFNRPITVKVEQGTPMGLLFMTDVMEKH